MTTGFSIKNDLRLVIDIAEDWAGEYGFSSPDFARDVLAAAERLEKEFLDD